MDHSLNAGMVIIQQDLQLSVNQVMLVQPQLLPLLPPQVPLTAQLHITPIPLETILVRLQQEQSLNAGLVGKIMKNSENVIQWPLPVPPLPVQPLPLPPQIPLSAHLYIQPITVEPILV